MVARLVHPKRPIAPHRPARLFTAAVRHTAKADARDSNSCFPELRELHRFSPLNFTTRNRTPREQSGSRDDATTRTELSSIRNESPIGVVEENLSDSMDL